MSDLRSPLPAGHPPRHGQPARSPGRPPGPGVSVTAALLLTGALAGCGLLPQRSEGERLWRDRCAECHGLNGSGNTPRYMGNFKADLLDNSWEHGSEPGSWEVVIRDGVFGVMPANRDLTREQIKALVDYLRQLRGERRPRGGG